MKSDKKTKRPPFHEAFAEKVIKHLEDGTAPWQKPWHPGKTPMVPHNPQSGTVYKGVNRVSLAVTQMVEGYKDPRWMTLKQANDMGLRIKKGSHSEAVVYYQFTKEQDRLDDDGKPVLDVDGNPERETVRLDRPIMRGAHVFNGDQIEGMPPLELTDKAYEWDPEEKAESILAASGATIKHDQSDRAFYRYSEDAIHLPPKENFENPASYYGTAMHELGHWTRHETRLNRENGPFGSELYAREELRAEIASWMIGEDLGIPHEPGQHASYVASWVKALKEDPYEIVRACRDAEQIKGYVMGLEQRKELAQEKTIQGSKHREEDIAAMSAPTNPVKEKTFLNVPYAEKGEAKALGAKWDRAEKSWFIQPGTDLTPFEKWHDPQKVEFDRVYSMDRDALIRETAVQLPLYDKSTFELKLLSDRMRDELTAAREEAATLADRASLLTGRHEGQKPSADIADLPTALGKAEKTVADISSGYERTLRTLLFKQEQQREPTQEADMLLENQKRLERENPATEKTFLDVPADNFEVKKEAWRLGAQWDDEGKRWFAPEGTDLAPLAAWLPGKTPDKPIQLNPQEEFAKALESAGLDLRGALPVMDGQIHRVPLLDDKAGTLNGAYLGHADGVPNGWADNFKTGERAKWVSNGHTLTDEQKAHMREEAMRRKEERMKNIALQQDGIAGACQDYYSLRPPAHSDHAYLVKKGISAEAFRISPTGKELVVPLINTEGEIRSLQHISEDGSKRFMPGGQKKGCFFLLGADVNKDEKSLASGEIILAEGVATGASLQMATGKPVAVAFDSGNLEAVAVKLREKFPNAAITICADNDHGHTRNDTLYNVGVEKAKAAAQRVGGKVKVPAFSKEEKARGLTDFNDLHKVRGLDSVRKQVGGKSLNRDSGMSL